MAPETFTLINTNKDSSCSWPKPFYAHTCYTNSHPPTSSLQYFNVFVLYFLMHTCPQGRSNEAVEAMHLCTRYQGANRMSPLFVEHTWFTGGEEQTFLHPGPSWPGEIRGIPGALCLVLLNRLLYVLHTMLHYWHFGQREGSAAKRAPSCCSFHLS